MKIKIFQYGFVFLFAILLSCSASANSWEDSFHQYPTPRVIVAQDGFELKASPSEDSKTIKTIYQDSKLEVMGYFDNLSGDKQRFYMSVWSWKQLQKGKQPNWVLIRNGGQGGEYWKSTWRDKFVTLSSIEQVYADSHMVKKVPSIYSKDIKIITQPKYVNVAGYVDSDDGRFYMSDWSWRRLSEGHDPNWVYIHKSSVSTNHSPYYSNIRDSHRPTYTLSRRSSSYSSSSYYNSDKERLVKRSFGALAQFAATEFIDNPVAAAVIGEVFSSVIEDRGFSPQGVVEGSLVNAASYELRKRGHSGLAAGVDIGNTLLYILGE